MDNKLRRDPVTRTRLRLECGRGVGDDTNIDSQLQTDNQGRSLSLGQRSESNCEGMAEVR